MGQYEYFQTEKETEILFDLLKNLAFVSTLKDSIYW